MTAENDLIEQIVANVLAELQPKSPLPVRAPAATISPIPSAKLETPIVELDLPVITADLLSEKVRHGQSVRIGRRSVLTPSARDWLQTRKTNWSRLHQHHSTSPGAARWLLLLTTVTPAVATLRSTLTDWKSELLGTPVEAAELAIRLICTGEVDGVLGVCSAAETMACLANRNTKVRAAVLSSAASLPALMDQLSPNVLVIDPSSKSLMELKNLTRAVAALPRSRGGN